MFHCRCQTVRRVRPQVPALPPALQNEMIILVLCTWWTAVKSKCYHVEERKRELAWKEEVSQDSAVFPSHIGPWVSHFKMEVFSEGHAMIWEETTAECHEGSFLNTRATSFAQAVVWNWLRLQGPVHEEGFPGQAFKVLTHLRWSALYRALAGRELSMDVWGGRSGPKHLGVAIVTPTEMIIFPSELGQRSSQLHLFRLTPHLLSDSVFPLCVFCCMWKSNMGVEKKVLGQIMQYGWKCFPCADLA